MFRRPLISKTSTAVTTLDPLNKGSNQTLSESNLVVSHGVTTDFNNVKATTSKTTGKWYFEVTNVSGGGLHGGGVPGVAMVLPSFNSQTYTEANGGTTFLTYGEIRYSDNGSLTTGFAPWSSAGITCYFAVDLTTRKIWAKPQGASRWNASSADNPATGAVGYELSRPGHGPDNAANAVTIAIMTYNNGHVFRLNTGQVPFVGTVPTGFSAWG